MFQRGCQRFDHSVWDYEGKPPKQCLSVQLQFCWKMFSMLSLVFQFAPHDIFLVAELRRDFLAIGNTQLRTRKLGQITRGWHFLLPYFFVRGFLKLNFQETLKEVCQELATEIGILCKWGTLGRHLLRFSFFNYFDKTATIYTIVGCIFPLPRFCRFFLAATVMANFLSSNLKFVYFSKSIFV